MRLLLSSEEDPASRNIRTKVLDVEGWSEVGSFQGHPLMKRSDFFLATIDGIHIFAEGMDGIFRSETGMAVEEIIVLSRHKAASGIPTLTVHPIGNYGKADFGGREGVLVPAPARTLTSLLRQLSVKALGLPFQVSFEVTHHGPYLGTPTCFIEIGSSADQWRNEEAARAIASSILSLQQNDDPVAIGIGGGHYAPRFSEVCIAKKVAFGHMVPNYALEGADDDRTSDIFQKAKEASDATLAYLHKKSMSRPRAAQLKAIADNIGLKVVESSDLEDRV
ncbi:MAG TPA: D-aminoacyl-tRNA deacylase [Methanomassiliicoccales archaeon]|nr:D-aminoacyl-tRNA deacylase [Methanomassiliicoccales archaeon]